MWASRSIEHDTMDLEHIYIEPNTQIHKHADGILTAYTTEQTTL